MTPSQDAIALVKTSEGLRLQAYQDSGGVWTIGYGHTEGVTAGQVITAAEADALLQTDLSEAGDEVESLVRVPLTQGQFDALTDFVFNLGAEALKRSTLLMLLNVGNYAAAANQFRVWVLDAGAVQPGLVTRRAAERALFVKPTGGNA
jgi:lysozyme